MSFFLGTVQEDECGSQQTTEHPFRTAHLQTTHLQNHPCNVGVNSKEDCQNRGTCRSHHAAKTKRHWRDDSNRNEVIGSQIEPIEFASEPNETKQSLSIRRKRAWPPDSDTSRTKRLTMYRNKTGEKDEENQAQLGLFLHFKITQFHG